MGKKADRKQEKKKGRGKKFSLITSLILSSISADLCNLDKSAPLILLSQIPVLC
jgi:hypothetical protein